jgi:hypothetical protein
VKVDSKPLFVEVPRAWHQKAVDNGQSLLVSTSTSAWQSNPETEGVFLGLVNAPTLPSSVAAPAGCTAGPGTKGQTGSQANVTFRLDCGSNPAVVEQYRKLDDSTLLRVQVRAKDEKTRTSVLESATYQP